MIAGRAVDNVSHAPPELAAVPGPGPSGRAADRGRYIAEIFAAHHRALRLFVARMLRNEDDVADTVQDVFLRVAQLPDPAKLEINARAYLFRIAEHLVIDRVRRERFRQVQQHDPLDAEAELEGAAPSIEHQVHWQRAIRQISERLTQAGPRVCRVVEMSCLDDFTHPEIAARLGVTTRTVERCMQRARKVCEPFRLAA